MKEFSFNGLTAEFFQRGWWSRVYEYAWLRDICKSFFDNKCDCSAIDIATGAQHPAMFIIKDTGFSRVVGTDLFDQKDFFYSMCLGSGVEYIKDDLLNPKIEEKFDCVSCISLLEHLGEDVQELAVRNLISYLKPSGCLALTFDMPGFDHKTDLRFYKKVLSENGFNIRNAECENSVMVRTSTCPNAHQDLRVLDLSCYRIFAWK